MQFEFATAARILFGPGTLAQVPASARQYGTQAFVVTGRSPARAEPLLHSLKAHGIETFTFAVSGEPEVRIITEGRELAVAQRCDLVISIGGGSVIDAGKAIAAMLTNPGELLDHLEVIGKAQPLRASPAPFIAIPTTAGTGSEVTRNAVIGSPEHKVKVSLRSPSMLPKLAVVDPQLTLGVPPDVTAYTGLDALTQLIEPYVSCRHNPLIDGICLEGIHRAAKALPVAYRDGNNAAAREDMCLASLFGGLALANAGLGAVHGFAGPIGGMFSAPHGAVCAALLPYVMTANIRALRDRGTKGALTRYSRVAEVLTDGASSEPESAAAWVLQLIREFGIKPLSAYGLSRELLPEVVEKSEQASSMKANPLPLTRRELTHTLLEAL